MLDKRLSSQIAVLLGVLTGLAWISTVAVPITFATGSIVAIHRQPAYRPKNDWTLR